MHSENCDDLEDCDRSQDEFHRSIATADGCWENIRLLSADQYGSDAVCHCVELITQPDIKRVGQYYHSPTIEWCQNNARVVIGGTARLPGDIYSIHLTDIHTHAGAQIGIPDWGDG